MKTLIAFVFIAGSLLLSTASFADQKYNPYGGSWSYEPPGYDLEYNPFDGQWEYPSW